MAKQDVRNVVRDMQSRLQCDTSLRFQLKEGCFSDQNKVVAILKKYQEIRRMSLPRTMYNEVKAYLIENYMAKKETGKVTMKLTESNYHRLLSGMDFMSEGDSSDKESDDYAMSVPDDQLTEEDDEDANFGQYEDFELDGRVADDEDQFPDEPKEETTTDYDQNTSPDKEDDSDEDYWGNSVQEADDEDMDKVDKDPTEYNFDLDEEEGDEVEEPPISIKADDDMSTDEPAPEPEALEDPKESDDMSYNPNQPVSVDGKKGLIVSVDEDEKTCKVSFPSDEIVEDGEDAEPNKVMVVPMAQIQSVDEAEDDEEGLSFEPDTEEDDPVPDEDEKMESIMKRLKSIKESVKKLETLKLPKAKLSEKRNSLMKQFKETKKQYTSLKKEGRFSHVVPGQEIGSRVIYAGNLMGTVQSVKGNALAVKLDNGGTVVDGLTEFELLDQSPTNRTAKTNTVAEGKLVRLKENKSVSGRVIRIESKTGVVTIKLKEGSILKTKLSKLESADQTQPDPKVQSDMDDDIMDRFEDSQEDNGTPDVRSPEAKAADTLDDIDDKLSEAKKFKKYVESLKRFAVLERFDPRTDYPNFVLDKVAEIISGMHESHTLEDTIKVLTAGFLKLGVILTHVQAVELIGKVLAKRPNLKDKIKEQKKLKTEQDVDQEEGPGVEIKDQTDKLEPEESDTDKLPVAESEESDDEDLDADLEPEDKKDESYGDPDEEDDLNEDAEIDAAIADQGKELPIPNEEDTAKFEAKAFLKGMFSTLKVIPEQLMEIRVKHLNPKYESTKFIKLAIRNQFVEKRINGYVRGKKLS